MRVSPLSMQDLDDLYAIRVTGEALAIWLTVPVLRDADFDALEGELELIEGGDADAHRRFHAGLRVGAGDRLRMQLDQLFEHAERYHRAFYATPDRAFVTRKLAEHREILQACRDRDRRLAREMIVEHLSTTAHALMTAERYAPISPRSGPRKNWTTTEKGIVTKMTGSNETPATNIVCSKNSCTGNGRRVIARKESPTRE
jgi:DNA-binding GntR family transcriptional regulator